MKLYQRIATELRRLAYTGRPDLVDLAEEQLRHIEQNHLPSGSGIDCGTKIYRDYSLRDIILKFSYHAMDENGFYDGWYDYTLTLSPDFVWGFQMHLDGNEEYADYLLDVFQDALEQEVE